MQSWGVTSRWNERDTLSMPTKSGVLGLVCAAIGRDRAEPVNDLAGLRMGVRVLRPGLLQRDYQTVNGALSLAGTPAGKSASAGRTVVTQRYYLGDADFIVGLEAEPSGAALLETIYLGLQAPHWPLALGRKSHVPSLPVWVAPGVLTVPLRQALLDFTDSRFVPAEEDTRVLRLALDSPDGPHLALDQPIAPFALRHFGVRRFVIEDVVRESMETNDVPA